MEAEQSTIWKISNEKLKHRNEKGRSIRITIRLRGEQSRPKELEGVKHPQKKSLRMRR